MNSYIDSHEWIHFFLLVLSFNIILGCCGTFSSVAQTWSGNPNSNYYFPYSGVEQGNRLIHVNEFLVRININCFIPIIQRLWMIRPQWNWGICRYRWRTLWMGINIYRLCWAWKKSATYTKWFWLWCRFKKNGLFPSCFHLALLLNARFLIFRILALPSSFLWGSFTAFYIMQIKYLSYSSWM